MSALPDKDGWVLKTICEMLAVTVEVSDEVRVELDPELDSEDEEVELSEVEDVEVEVEVLSELSSVIVTLAVGEQAEARPRIKRVPQLARRERLKPVARLLL